MNSIEGITGMPSIQGAQNILLILVIVLKDRLVYVVLKYVVVAKIQSFKKSRKLVKNHRNWNIGRFRALITS